MKLPKILAAIFGLTVGLFIGCQFVPSKTATDCMIRYQNCTSATNMTDYLICRDAVDVTCIPQKSSNTVTDGGHE